MKLDRGEKTRWDCDQEDMKSFGLSNDDAQEMYE